MQIKTRYNTGTPASLKELYAGLADKIGTRLAEFSRVRKTADNERLFSELCFCLLTPQSRARICWDAVLRLKGAGLLLRGGPGQVRRCLKGVRFKNKKAEYVFMARKQLGWIKAEIRGKRSVFELRELLVQKVYGLGYKEAGHFLRNIGLGKDIAILDRHILKNLKLFGVIKNVPASITRKKYLDIEQKTLEFAGKIRIPMESLDLLLWAKETGEVFK